MLSINNKEESIMVNSITTSINVNDEMIGIMRVGDVDYISLTDLANYSNPDYPSHVIVQWLSNKTTFNYLGLWEKINNSSFNFTEFSKIKKDEVGLYAFTMSPRRCLE